MGGYPTAPSPYAGTSLLSQWLDPTTRYLFNQPTPDALPPPSAPAALPPANPYPGYGSAYAAPPSMAQSYAANQAQAQAMPGVTSPSIHEQYANLRLLDHMLRGGAAPADAYPLLQSMIEQGTLYPGQGGIGLSTAIPYGGPDAAKTQRLIDLYERYQDFLNAGNAPVTGSNPRMAVPRYLGTIGP